MDDQNPWKVNKKYKKYKKIDQDLLNSAYFGNEQLVKKYIEKGGDINFMEDRDGWKGIHYASRWNNVNMLLHYIKAGCDLNCKTKNKETSLHKCARWDCKNCAIILLEKGADPKIKNSDGDIPSNLTNNPEMKFLLDHYDEYKKIQKEEGIDNIRIIFSKEKKIIKSPIKEYINNKIIK